MRLAVFAIAAATIASPLVARAQGYSVVAGGSTHADAPAAPPPANPAGTAANPAPATSAGSATVTPASNGGSVHATSNGGATSDRQPWDYAGLTPGAPSARIPGLSRRETRRAGGRPIVAWPGFQVTPNGSRVFVATTGPVTVSAGQHTPGRWTFRISRAYIPLSNNRRPLVTSSFSTPVDRAFVRQRGSDAEIVIEMQGDAPPQMTQQAGNPRGLSFIFFDFGRWERPGRDARDAGPAPGNQGVRLSPSNGPASPDVGPADGSDDERPPPVQR